MTENAAELPAEALASLTRSESDGILIVRDNEKTDWVHVQLAPDRWAMVRVGGDTIVRRANKQLGDLEFEIERLRTNKEFEE